MSSVRKSRRQAPELPPDIHSALVETLFGTTGAFVSGLLGAILVPTIAYARTRENVYLICLAVVGALSIVRLGVYIAHKKASGDNRAGRARFWEAAYAVGAIGFMLSVGVTAALLFVRNADQISILYGDILTMGCAGALAGRNAGRPFIVYGQVLGVCGPLAVAMFFRHDPWFWGAAVILLFVMTAVKSTTKVLNATIVTALLEGREARLQRTRLGAALDSMSHGLCMADASQTIVVMNDRLKAFFGLEVQSGSGLSDLANSIGLAARMSRAGRVNFVSRWRAHVARGETCVFTQEIQQRLYDFRCEPMPNGGFVVVVEDVTEARLASREIERMAHFDSLTGLPNRNNFHSSLQKALARPRGKQDLVLLSIDLDQFKEVNDTRGHPAGDELLRQVAARLRENVTRRDMVARFGGDEFQVLVPEQEDSGRAEELAERLIAVLSDSYEVFGATVTIGASIGLSRASQEGPDADEMLRCADLALYEAKGAGRGVVRAYRRDMDLALRRKRHVEAVLRRAIAEQTLEVYYQPIIDIRTGRVKVCEALARLRCPDEGMISPAEFIPVAEESDLILGLGEAVLRKACAEATAWPEDVAVAVNFSPRQFAMNSDIIEDLKSVLRSTGLSAHRLEVEITESTMIEAKNAHAQLEGISALGVRIALDDFGTGYSSLSYLRQYPVNKIKIDRSFADEIDSVASQAVIGAVSVLAERLQVDVVFEGLEQPEQLEYLKPWGVHLVQGYLFGAPMPAAQIRERLVENPTRRVA
ncbi:MAG: putative bifunctional diguanylate cyclase/phosphodiesterase [Caulobacteraceae bacterium]